MTEPLTGDAFGMALLSHLDHGDDGWHVIERDDGWVDGMPASRYFGDIEAWVPIERDAIGHAGDRVLDVGAGAGRTSLFLQERGKDVVALDVSAGAIEVCRRRGVEQTFLGTVFDLVASDPEPFDTFVFFGNNLGLLGSPEGAAKMLGALRALGRPDARIIGTLIDPYDTDNPAHLGYHEQNRKRNRLPGQIALRIRYSSFATPWKDLLWVSLEELTAITGPLGWDLTAHWEQGPFRAVVLTLRP